MLQSSQRGRTFPESPFRMLLPYAHEAETNGTKVYRLNIGQPDILSPQKAIEMISGFPTPKLLPYTPGIGILTLREKFARYYQKFQMPIEVDDIMITQGGSEGIYFTMLAAFDPGDEILVPEPFYANYLGFAQMTGVILKPITCSIKDGFHLPPIAEIDHLYSPKVKGVLITNPNNPTGTVYHRDELKSLAKWVKERSLFLLTDEVYREFSFDLPYYPVYSEPGLDENIILIDSISKRFSACGARIGTVVTRNQAIKNSITRLAKLRLSNPFWEQTFAELALEEEDSYLDGVANEYRERRNVVHRALENMDGVTSYLPEGAFYCFAGLPIDDSMNFCKWLLCDFTHQGATLMVSPGFAFYMTPGRGMQEIRLAYVINQHDLAKAMECLSIALQQYPGRIQV